MKMIKIIWANERLRHRISKMKLKGKNVIQAVAESYGLTFNLISMLWDSGLFQQLPKFIKNEKSRKIIEQKYGQPTKQHKIS